MAAEIWQFPDHYRLSSTAKFRCQQIEEMTKKRSEPVSSNSSVHRWTSSVPSMGCRAGSRTPGRVSDLFNPIGEDAIWAACCSCKDHDGLHGEAWGRASQHSLTGLVFFEPNDLFGDDLLAAQAMGSKKVFFVIQFQACFSLRRKNLWPFLLPFKAILICSLYHNCFPFVRTIRVCMTLKKFSAK